MRKYNKRILFILIYGAMCQRLFAQNENNIEKPDEAAMFGNDAENIESIEKTEKDKTEKEESPLQVGGVLYYRFIASPQVDAKASETPISLPLQVDGFLDGRPNDRLRVFINARLMYDATRDKYSQTTSGTSLGNSQTSSTAQIVNPVAQTNRSVPDNPKVVLDQAWLKFDIARLVFITAGNQHVKWGTARFWNPTDFLNTQKRDPLLGYDLRLGLPMLRIEAPLQTISSNFSALAFFDQPIPASTMGQLGGASRFETVIGNTEFGLDAVYRDDPDNKYSLVFGADFSAPLGPFDIYAEAAYIMKSQNIRYTLADKITEGIDLGNILTEESNDKPVFMVSGGLNFSFNWLENRTATIGAEYFFNQSGYDTALIYPVLILKGQYQPFYVGKHYAAIYLMFEGPDPGKHTSYTLSVLSNLSDQSLIGRLDFSWNILTYLSFQMFVDGRFGTKGGEFNFSLDIPSLYYNGVVIPEIKIPGTIFDVGISFRTRF